ncbi:MAG TPA: penicillin-binding protein 1C [Candidatus Cybelea sp.]|nr:penicillin-binding protein 1C [Candidatus Cybelea sp.]
MRRGIAYAAAALVALAALAAALDRMFPPDLSRFRDGSTIVTDAEGNILRAFTTRDGMWRLKTAPGDVEPRYLAMLKAYEDHRFDEHFGVDPLALVRAAWQAASSGHVVSGGSTLTMQAARLLEPHPHTLLGKLADMARATQLEIRYGKRQILAFYLTLAPFGGNLEGVRAASLAYFGKEPLHLTDAQAALLIALPQSPTRRRPEIDAGAARQAETKVLSRLVTDGFLDQERMAEALEQPLPVTRRPMPFHVPQLAQRLASTAPNGSRIATTIDGALQNAVEALAAQDAASRDSEASIALLVIENRTRAVRAALSGTDFFGPYGQIDLTLAARSPGSTLKPFIYGLAFDDLLIHPETLIDDKPLRFGAYAPRNFDRGFHGTVPVRVALQQSLNVPAVAILDRVGPERLAATLRGAGARLDLPQGGEPAALPIALGGVGISLADLVMLYAGIADGGAVRPLIYSGGARGGAAQRVMTPTAAAYVTRILAGTPLPDGVVSRSSSQSAGWIAYKTGTSYGFRDAWAVGYSANYTIGVWVGRADGTPRPDAYGRNTAAPILFKLFDLLPAAGGQPLPQPGADAIDASSAADLPPALRHFTPGNAPPEARAPNAEPLAIAYPLDGTVVELRAGADGKPAKLALMAEGGTEPLRWVVNGAPVVASARGGDFWQPDGEGFAAVTVIDAKGRSATSTVRLAKPE